MDIKNNLRENTEIKQSIDKETMPKKSITEKVIEKNKVQITPVTEQQQNSSKAELLKQAEKLSTIKKGLSKTQKVTISTLAGVAAATAIVIPLVGHVINNNTNTDIVKPFNMAVYTNYDNAEDGQEVFNITPGTKISELKPITKEGYIFKGYFMDEDCTQAYDPNYVIQENDKIYALLVEDIKHFTTTVIVESVGITAELNVNTKMTIEQVEELFWQWLAEEYDFDTAEEAKIAFVEDFKLDGFNYVGFCSDEFGTRFAENYKLNTTDTEMYLGFTTISYRVSVPSGEGYVITDINGDVITSFENIPHGEEIKFKVRLTEGYFGTPVVKVGDTILTEVNEVYTFEVTSESTVSVSGLLESLGIATINLGDSTQSIQVAKGQTLAQALEAQGLTLETTFGFYADENYTQYVDISNFDITEDITLYTLMATEGLNISDGVVGENGYGLFSGEVVIPYMHNSQVVTSITFTAFMGNELTKVYIPAGVTSINDAAFNYCYYLTNVVLPKGLQRIGNYAFADTTLSHFTIPESVTEIGLYAFYNSGLSSIDIAEGNTIYSNEGNCLIDTRTNTLIQGFSTSVIPNWVEIIDDSAFDSVSISSITIPASVTSIGRHAFSHCTELTQIIFEDPNGWTINGNVISLTDSTQNATYFKETYASQEWTKQEVLGIVSVNLGDTTQSAQVLNGQTLAQALETQGLTEETTIGFYSDENYTQYVDINNLYFTEGVTLYTRVATLDKIKITDGKVSAIDTAISGEVVIPYAYEEGILLTIAESGFENCINLTSIIIPNSITTIESKAFNGCTELTEVNFGTGLQSVGADAFLGCKKVKVNTTDINSFATIDFADSEANPVFYAQYIYENDVLVTNINLTGITKIGSYAFISCKGITSINIPDTVTSIGAHAFNSCEVSGQVVIPDSVTEMGECAFNYCYNMTSIIVGNGIKTIGRRAFADCHMLTEITLGSSVETIIYDAFKGCKKLTSITIPDSVTSIGNTAFSGCVELQEVNFGSDIQSIGTGVFDGCVKIISVTVKNNYVLDYVTTNFGQQLTTIIVGEGVNQIKENQFKNYTTLTSVTIADSVTSIGKSAFNGCTELIEVNFGTGLQSVGADAFLGCKKVKVNTTDINSFATIDFADSEANPVFYAQYIYENDVLVTNINLTGITKIGSYVFIGCKGITSINIPDTVTSIGAHAFNSCEVSGQVVIPDSVTEMGECAFNYCYNITSIIVGNGIKTIGRRAFADCHMLIEITLGSSVETIIYDAFKGCKKLTSITIPASVKRIEQNVFNGCTTLTQITFEDPNDWYVGGNNISLTNPTQNATYFKETYASQVWIKQEVVGIVSVNLGNTTQSISVFEGQTLAQALETQGLTEETTFGFYSDENYTQYVDINNLYFTEGVTLYTLMATEGLNISDGVVGANGYGSFSGEVVIPYSVTSIGAYAFYGCGSLTSITIPAGVTSIGYSAFSGCSSLTSITIPAGVTSIESNAFYGCSSLTSIIIPNSVTSIGSYAFRDCSSLTSIIISDSVTSIGDSAFYGCSSLTSIKVEEGNSVYHSAGNCLIETASKTLIVGCNSSTIPTDGSVTSIGYSAFRNCSGLTSIIIPEGVTSIGDGAFCDCSSLTSITIPTSVTSIANSAFYGCSSLQYNISNRLKYLGNTSNPYLALVDIESTNITTATIKQSCKIIGMYALSNCSSLTNITIPTSVTSIGDGAFGGCSSLTSITIPSSVTSIGVDVFNRCNSLTSIKVEEGNSVYHSSGNCLIETASKTLIAGCNSSTIPTDGSVTSIERYAFRDCSSLTSIIIPDSVTSIGMRAFFNCSSLTSIIIPEGVTSIEMYAFSGCSSLTSVIFEDPNNWYVGGNNLSLNNPEQNATYLKGTYGNYDWAKQQ